MIFSKILNTRLLDNFLFASVLVLLPEDMLLFDLSSGWVLCSRLVCSTKVHVCSDLPVHIAEFPLLSCKQDCYFKTAVSEMWYLNFHLDFLPFSPSMS